MSHKCDEYESIHIEPLERIFHSYLLELSVVPRGEPKVYYYVGNAKEQAGLPGPYDLIDESAGSHRLKFLMMMILHCPVMFLCVQFQ